MHLSPDQDVKPNPSVELADKQTPGVTTYKVEQRNLDFRMMQDKPKSYQAPPFGSAQPMKRTSDADPDGDVFHGSCSNNVGTGEPIPLARDGSIITEPAPTGPAPYQPTADERAEADAWRLEAGTQ